MFHLVLMLTSVVVVKIYKTRVWEDSRINFTVRSKLVVN